MKVDPLCTPGSVRIAVLGSTYPRTPSDHQVPWLREWVKRLAARGYEVLVFAPDCQGLDDQVIDGVPVRRFRYAPGRCEILTHGEGAPNKLKKNPMFSGRLIERNGVNFLLRAMPLILAHRKVRPVITGDGHCRAKWENLARELGLHESVTFAGYSREDNGK